MLGTNESRNLFSCTKNFIRTAIVFAGKLVYTVVQALSAIFPTSPAFLQNISGFQMLQKNPVLDPIDPLKDLRRPRGPQATSVEQLAETITKSDE